MLTSLYVYRGLRYWNNLTGLNRFHTLGRLQSFPRNSRICDHVNETSFNLTVIASSSPCLKRFYTPTRHINWIGIKKRWRCEEILMKKRKHKFHSRVGMRFRLTRFGWERLQKGRKGNKLHLSIKQRRNKKRIRFVSRHDLVKLTRQMPSYRFVIRDPTTNYNPNSQILRKKINSYFA
ncbi:hypothetical protein BBOV_III000140 [Babesia bovis T2Bo]|uniref:Uncharacterized protein n=1 Tax=Babesia bovis TaxID=5865 RepID=A7ALZ9_BABBO|nr:hypothetical protein BBOV_III000140 [Babesia bovis T2Bo]EDO07583.1 hypothetical protein BBOV_III000140 [Babesia bovis T2Bo]BAN64612.1 conserved hypothetical protein [Babesia bovis]|eukprot:XP_001611151.1 hypothetical protein [Babesia bovis T2Bo]